MGSFREFVNSHDLKELYMHGRTYTWSNGRDIPTMTCIDRALVSVDWDLGFPNALLQALSSSVSDHVPLHLATNAVHKPKWRFRFELFWLRVDGFEDAVKQGWTSSDSITDPFKWLDALYRNLAVFLQSWGQRKVGNVKLQIAVANIVIHRFELAQERRHLNPGELWLLRTLKVHVLGLSSFERTIARQRSRLRWLREGDASTKLFYAIANGRKTKKFIPSIMVGDQLITN